MPSGRVRAIGWRPGTLELCMIEGGVTLWVVHSIFGHSLWPGVSTTYPPGHQVQQGVNSKDRSTAGIERSGCGSCRLSGSGPCVARQRAGDTSSGIVPPRIYISEAGLLLCHCAAQKKGRGVTGYVKLQEGL